MVSRSWNHCLNVFWSGKDMLLWKERRRQLLGAGVGMEMASEQKEIPTWDMKYEWGFTRRKVKEEHAKERK